MSPVLTRAEAHVAPDDVPCTSGGRVLAFPSEEAVRDFMFALGAAPYGAPPVSWCPALRPGAAGGRPGPCDVALVRDWLRRAAGDYLATLEADRTPDFAHVDSDHSVRGNEPTLPEGFPDPDDIRGSWAGVTPRRQEDLRH